METHHPLVGFEINNAHAVFGLRMIFLAIIGYSGAINFSLADYAILILFFLGLAPDLGDPLEPMHGLRNTGFYVELLDVQV